MRREKTWMIIGLVLLLSSCVPSLHPLFTEKDLMFDPGLVGVWREADEESVWTFKKSGENAYNLNYREDGKPAEFEAHLVRVGRFLFLDIYPQEPKFENDFYKLHLVPAHTFFRIWRDGDVLKLAMLDGHWLKKMIAQKQVHIAHERLDDRLVLTASSQALQELVLQYAEDVKAFPDPVRMVRQK